MLSYGQTNQWKVFECNEVFGAGENRHLAVFTGPEQKKGVRIMSYISYKKLSRKLRRAEDLKRRRVWDGLCPVTRRVESRKSYCRARIKRETRILAGF
jgi:hypothetical protein